MANEWGVCSFLWHSVEILNAEERPVKQHTGGSPIMDKNIIKVDDIVL